jgi:hypothetical protein
MPSSLTGPPVKCNGTVARQTWRSQVSQHSRPADPASPATWSGRTTDNVVFGVAAHTLEWRPILTTHTQTQHTIIQDMLADMSALYSWLELAATAGRLDDEPHNGWTLMVIGNLQHRHTHTVTVGMIARAYSVLRAAMPCPWNMSGQAGWACQPWKSVSLIGFLQSLANNSLSEEFCVSG